MTDEQYITLLSCLGDIQTAVDAIGLDVERLCEDVLEDDPRRRGFEDRSSTTSTCSSSLEAPSWVNGGGSQSVDTDSENEPVTVTGSSPLTVSGGRLQGVGPAIIALAVFAGYGVLVVAAIVVFSWMF